VTIENQKRPPQKRGEQSAQPRERIEGKLPLGLVKSSGAKNIVFAPNVLKSRANRKLPILPATVKKGEDVVPICHAS